VTRITQEEVNAIVLALVGDEDLTEFARVAEAIRAGAVEVTVRQHSVSLRVLPRGARADFAQRLRELREAAGKTVDQISAEIEVSDSSLIRALNGYALPQWPIIRALIEACGGSPEDYRADWRAAYDDRARG
jgi:DNA-binding XRE family transcriptional regulator